jgi:ribosomal protein L18
MKIEPTGRERRLFVRRTDKRMSHQVLKARDAEKLPL